MSEDYIAQVRETLHLGEDRTGELTIEDALPVLRQLAENLQAGQRAIGMVLWHLDAQNNPAVLQEVAEMLSLKPLTLKSWINTYSRLRQDTELAVLNFSMQQQLARIMNAEDRKQLWESRSADKWTLTTLTEAVDIYLGEIGSSVMPRTKHAGCRAKFSEDKQVKVNVELYQDSVIVKITSSEGSPLSEMDFDQLSEGVYQVKFDW
jgi:hypothetical protein